MATQSYTISLFFLTFLSTVLVWRIVYRYFNTTPLFLVFCFPFAQIGAFLFFAIVIKPSVSKLRHLPTASQPPFYRRLFKEPNAFHFERWINETPNQGVIRYFGVLNQERLLVTRPEAVNEILHLKHEAFEKLYSHKTNILRAAGQILPILEGASHRHHRKIIAPAFRSRRLFEKYYPVFLKKSVELCDIIDSEIKPPTKDSDKLGQTRKKKSPMILDDHFSRVIFDIVGLTTFTHDFKCLSDPHLYHTPYKPFIHAFKPSAAQRFRLVLALMLPTWIVNRLPIEFNRETGPAIDKARADGAEVIMEKRLRHAHGAASDITSYNPHFPEKCISKHATELRNDTDDILDIVMKSSKFSDTQMIDQYMMFTAGATHSSIVAIKSIIWFLAQTENLHYQETLRNEIRMTLDSIGQETRWLRPSDIERLPYLTAIRDEVLRLHSAFSALGREAIDDVEVCGISIPKGTSIAISPWALHRSFEVWGSDAKRFNPDRWLDGVDMASRTRRPAPKQSAYIPFGMGSRSCIARVFAEAELSCLIAAIFSRFHIEFAEKELPKVSNQMTFDFVGNFKVLVTPIGQNSD